MYVVYYNQGFIHEMFALRKRLMSQSLIMLQLFVTICFSSMRLDILIADVYVCSLVLTLTLNNR